MSIHISSAFDGGAIEVVSIEPLPVLAAERPTVNIRLRLRADNASDFRQWFYFRLQGAAGVRCVMRFENCAESAYPEGWPGYRALASSDRNHWFRIEHTRYEDGQLVVEWAPDAESVYLAYFEPYSWERHLDFLSRVGGLPQVRVSRLGATLEGRDLDCITIGTPAPGKKNVWVIARQHPGETMAQWFVEGLVERLLQDSPEAQAWRGEALWHVVPNMNPDGSVRGNLRTNAAGANLNREWMTPSLEKSPEVWWVRQRMHQTGVDVFLDVHGDESLPYVFIDGSHMLPGRSAEQIAREQRFVEAVRAACPDFQSEQGYRADRFGEELLTLASKYVGHTFGCLSVTLEMPFKDNALAPDAQGGWSAARSYALGAQMVEALFADVVKQA